MPLGPPAEPATREYRNHHLDSTRWDHLTPRPDDIVITTAYKSGTTWMQQIVGSLVLWPRPPSDDVVGKSEWLDARFHAPVEEVIATLEAQTHRRFIKTHLAADGLPFWHELSYIVVGRDTRDVFMSLWNHYSGHSEEFIDRLNGDDRPGPPFPHPPEDPRDFWRDWCTRGWFPWENDGWPYWSHHHHASTWWARRDRSNVLFVHYADLLADLEGEMRRVAGFLGAEPPPEAWPALTEAATFDAMSAQARALEEEAGALWSAWRRGSATFFHKGTNGRWRDVLTDADLDLYERAVDGLDPSLRRWLEGGRRAVDPQPDLRLRPAGA